MDYAVSTNCLTKQYRKSRAVDEVSLHVKKGEIYGFIGRNGAGKTTCMKIISGLASPTSGEISLFGETGAKIRDCYNRIGTLIEAPGLYPKMTAYDNMKMKCLATGIYDDGYIKEKLELVGLDGVGKKKIKQYSLGMKQRLGIAIALIGEPDMLVLDEPINGLDPQGIVEVRETLLRLKHEKKMTIMISSHILEELSKLADSYGIINDGKLIQELTSEQLMEKYTSYIEITTALPQKACVELEKMGLKNYKVVDRNTVYVYEGFDMTVDINRKLVMADCEIAAIKVMSEELETYYLELTGGAAK